MAIIDAERVNAFLSNPQWNASQLAECERLCDELEDKLAARLNSPITPIPWSESVAVLGSGLVATTYPVASVTSIDGTAIPEGDPLPTGWTITRNRLRRDPALLGSGTLTLVGPYSGLVPRVAGVGSVAIAYMAGWGDVPALRDTLLRRVGAVMVNRHDDSVVITTDGEARQPRALKEDWTSDEIEKDLGIYRNLVAWR